MALIIKRTVILMFVLLIVASARAEGLFEGLSYNLRVGYSLGGTLPVGFPASIRKINSVKLTNNLQLGIDAKHSFDDHWGLMAGIHFENKGMNGDANVKSYHVKLIRGGQTLEGSYTGDVKIKVARWMFTLPVMATYTIGKVTLKAGPYVSFISSNTFEGYAHNGYLRVANPTGPKVQIGNTPDTKGTYDFSDKMRHFNWGLNGGADWYFNKKTGIYADISWGLQGIFHSDFNVVEQTLYPVFGTVGIIYKLK